MNTITRRLEIDAGHRLLRHEGKCRGVHGHRYAFELTVTAPLLDAVGRVVDFSVVKNLVGCWLDEEWDHGLLLQEGDPLIEMFRGDPLTKLVVVPWSPTIENLTWAVHASAVRLFKATDSHIEVVSVRGYETPNCWADYHG